MFRGVSTLNLDSKGRLTIPTRYRQRLRDSCAGQLVITIEAVERNRSLWLYPLPVWEQVEHDLVSLPAQDKKARLLQRLLIGHASECEMDTQGRTLLPAELREYAGLTKRAVLVGLGRKFELWDEQHWLSNRQAWLEQDDDDAAWSEALGNLSL